MADEPGSDETPSDRLNDALLAFTAAVGGATDVCSYGFTIGESYVPFAPDEDEECDDDDVMCSQVWVRVTSVTPTSVNEGFGGNGCSVDLSIGLEVGILRCFEARPEGEAPSATEVMEAGFQAMDDMYNIQCVALNTEVWDSIDLGQWVPVGPGGAQYGGIWTFTVTV